MEIKFDKKTLRNLGFWVLGLIGAYWLLHETSRAKALLDFFIDLLSPFIIGGVLAFIVNVPMRAIEGTLKKIKKDKLRRTVAIVLTLLAVTLVLAVVFMLLIPQLTETIQSLIPKLNKFVKDVEKYITEFQVEHPEIVEWLNNNTDFEKFDWSSIAQKTINILTNSLSAIVTGAFSAIGTLTSGLINAFVAVVFAVYTLFQKETLARQGRKVLYAIAPEKFSDSIVRILRLTNSAFSNFLSGQCIEVCILGSMFAVSMAIFQMPYIPLVSVLVAVTAFIPIVGAWCGCIIGAFLIFVSNPMQAIWFVVLFLVLQQIENNMIYPRVVGSSIGLSGMWVLVAISVGGDLMGVAGMFLMIPLASVLYTLVQEWIHKRLENLDVPAEKLQAQPPELNSKFKEKRKKTKEKIELRKLLRMQKKSK